MTSEELKRIINQEENLRLEFKQSFNNEAIVTINAFANTKGGILLIGVTNKGDIIGINKNQETIQNWLNEIKNKTSPSIIPNIETFSFKNNTIAIITVQEYPIKPISFKGRFYKRFNNSNHLLSIQEITNLHMQSLQTSWDAHVNPNTTIKKLAMAFWLN